jgi:hypothetical protein
MMILSRSIAINSSLKKRHIGMGLRPASGRELVQNDDMTITKQKHLKRHGYPCWLDQGYGTSTTTSNNIVMLVSPQQSATTVATTTDRTLVTISHNTPQQQSIPNHWRTTAKTHTSPVPLFKQQQIMRKHQNTKLTSTTTTNPSRKLHMICA